MRIEKINQMMDDVLHLLSSEFGRDVEDGEKLQDAVCDLFETHSGAELGSTKVTWEDRTEMRECVEWRIVRVTQEHRVLWSHSGPTAHGDLALIQGRGWTADGVRELVEREGVVWWGTAAVEFIRARWALVENGEYRQVWAPPVGP